MLAQGADIEGGDSQTFHFGIHPVFWVPIQAYLPHSLGFLQNFFVHSDFLWVEVIDDVELLKTAAATEHDIHHACLV